MNELEEQTFREAQLCLADNIISFRANRKETQEQFAEHCGITLYRAQKLEEASCNPSITLLTKVSEYMGCRLCDLFDKKHFSKTQD